ncbi:hypothetical protein GGF32_000775 [Allomyces javanicus]|nr:hypothetical protein GGF32_000775 [Allomyces javanicus]
MAALAHAMPAAALKDFLVLPFATPATRPHAAHAPEWLRSRPGPPLADREREMVDREKERVKRVAEAAAAAGAGGARSGAADDVVGAPPAKRARRGLAAALATAAVTAADAPAVPVQPVARAAADDPVVALQARLDLEIKHHDRLVNVTVDYIRGTESESDGEGNADAENNDDDDDDGEGDTKGRATGLAGRARRDRNEPGEYLRRVRALYVDLPPTPTPTAAGHESDAASDDGAVSARRRRMGARRRAVRVEMPPVELARRLDDVVRYMHVGPGPAVVAPPPPLAMDPRRGGAGAGGGRVGYVMSPDGGAVIAPRRAAGEK